MQSLQHRAADAAVPGAYCAEASDPTILEAERRNCSVGSREGLNGRKIVLEMGYWLDDVRVPSSM
ncbi:hypothetical protein NOR_01631 [Metarhizium rileyi]|uniref:Uncharacterized protein n=1 Tax=Metarhizium rileyi (strain RCEF 4871) TaxID=1649241 RepID=A0A167HVP4_METRR|nr:hypothetical protein NOR_01631 [Metarhizium rileyi RCEF 4871]